MAKRFIVIQVAAVALSAATWHGGERARADGHAGGGLAPGALPGPAAPCPGHIPPAPLGHIAPAPPLAPVLPDRIPEVPGDEEVRAWYEAWYEAAELDPDPAPRPWGYYRDDPWICPPPPRPCPPAPSDLSRAAEQAALERIGFEATD